MFADSVADAAPQLKVVSGTPITAGCRMIKDAHEIELMRLACQATLKVYEAVYHALEPGMTQNTVSRAHRRRRISGSVSRARPACRSANTPRCPTDRSQPQTIREGTIIMIDDGCTVEGYQSDITRTFVLGKATDKMNKVFDIVKQAQTAALKAARPGVPLEQLDAVARKIIVDAGYGPGFKYFSHRLGHGMGMDGHEWPYLVKNNMFGWEQGADRAARDGVQRRAGHLHPRGIRRAARRRHAHHRAGRGALHAAVGVAGKTVLKRCSSYFTQVTSDQIRRDVHFLDRDAA